MIKSLKCPNIYLVFCLLFASISCSEYKSEQSQSVNYEELNVIKIDKVSKKMISIDSLIVPGSINFIPLETTTNSSFGSVSKIFLTDSSYVIFDAQLESVYQFNKKGGYIRKIGEEGKGALEYTMIKTLSLNKSEGTLDILDVSKRLIKYDVSTGKALHERKLDFDNFTVDEYFAIDNNKFIVYNNFRLDMSKPQDTLYRLRYLNNDITIYQGLPYEFNLEKKIHPHRTRHSIYSYQGNTHFFEPFNSLVYLLNEDGIEVKYEIKYELTEEISTQEKVKNLLNGSQDLNRQYLGKVMETEKFLFLEFSEALKGQSVRFRRYALYDKENEKCLGNSIYSYFIVELGLEVFLHQLSDQLFVAAVPADVIVKYQTAYNDALSEDEISPLIQEVINLKIDVADNPVLILMKLN